MGKRSSTSSYPRHRNRKYNPIKLPLKIGNGATIEKHIELRDSKDAEQESEKESEPRVTTNINDLPTEVIRQIIKKLQPRLNGCLHDYTTFLDATEACRRWRTIGIELAFERNAQNWSPKKWSVMSVLMKHHYAFMIRNFARQCLPRPGSTNIPSRGVCTKLVKK